MISLGNPVFITPISIANYSRDENGLSYKQAYIVGSF